MSFLCYELGIHKFRDEHTRELTVWGGSIYIRNQRCQRCHETERELTSYRTPRRLRPYRKETDA